MRSLLLTIPILLFTIAVQAQPDKRPSMEQIELLKTKFITDKLDLTTEEAQKFWPIYNMYQKETQALWDQKRKNWYTNRDNPQQNLTTDLDIDGKILMTKKKYQTRFQSAIPPQKILMLYRSENEFREFLMRQIGRRGDGDRRGDDDKKDYRHN